MPMSPETTTPQPSERAQSPVVRSQRCAGPHVASLWSVCVASSLSVLRQIRLTSTWFWLRSEGCTSQQVRCLQ